MRTVFLCQGVLVISQEKWCYMFNNYSVFLRAAHMSVNGRRALAWFDATLIFKIRKIYNFTDVLPYDDDCYCDTDDYGDVYADHVFPFKAMCPSTSPPVSPPLQVVQYTLPCRIRIPYKRHINHDGLSGDIGTGLVDITMYLLYGAMCVHRPWTQQTWLFLIEKVPFW